MRDTIKKMKRYVIDWEKIFEIIYQKPYIQNV